MTNRTALITGATSGIGAAFARTLARSGHDLVLVARDADRLAASAATLREAHGVEVGVLPADLATADGCAAAQARLTQADAPIDLLVNNAGLGLKRPFLRSELSDEEYLLNVNVIAVMRLTHAVLPGMIERRRGGVINVSSASAFAPVMPGSTYPPSKAWVNAFSESLGLATRPFGVRVMALCPGYTRTEFHERAGIDMTKSPSWMWLDADRVVRDALRDLGHGKLVSVPDWRYKLAAFGMRHAPRSLLHRVARDTRSRIGRSGSADERQAIGSDRHHPVGR